MSQETLNRPLAIFLLTAFSLTQSIPLGWSADQMALDELGSPQPVVAVDEGQMPVVGANAPEGQETATEFLGKDSPLKRPEEPSLCLTCCGPPPCCSTCERPDKPSRQPLPKEDPDKGLGKVIRFTERAFDKEKGEVVFTFDHVGQGKAILEFERGPDPRCLGGPLGCPSERATVIITASGIHTNPLMMHPVRQELLVLDEFGKTYEVNLTFMEVSLRIVIHDKDDSTQLIRMEEEPADEIEPVPPVQKLVTMDLVRSLGLSEKNIEYWMKEGLIKIEISQDKQTAVAQIDPSVKSVWFANRGAVLVDPLELEELPSEITYEFENFGLEAVCLKEPCPWIGPFLKSAHFIVGQRVYQMSFDSNRLNSVRVVSDPGAGCIEEPCPKAPSRVLRDITFLYGDQGEIEAFIIHHVTPEEGRVIREQLIFKKMDDGQYHIDVVEQYEFDKSDINEGNLVATSKFDYSEIGHLCVMGTPCPPPIVRLEGIVRTDKEGKALSKIVDFKELKEESSTHSATVVLAGAGEEKVLFNTFEDLFLQVRKLEARRGPEIPPLQKLLASDLATNFGLSERSVESWMKEGLIKIEVSRDKGTAKVTIDPSIQHASFVNQGGVLVDPLGLKELPREINYQLYEQQVMCLGPGCLHTGIYLSSAEFQIRSRSYELKYKNIWIEGTLDGFHTNLLSEVNIYEEGREVATASYDYDLLDQPTAIITEELFQLVRERITASITYHDGSQGDIASRKVLLEKMEDGRYHIKTVEEYDPEGKLLVKNEFKYLTASADTPCLPGPGKGCPPRDITVHLFQILRTDSEGKSLSEIRDFGEAREREDKARYTATLVLAGGREEQILFNTLEELFLEARKLEARDSETPPAVQEFVDRLRQALGEDYVVEAGRSLIAIYPPQYWVTVHPKNGDSSKPPARVEVGHLQTISLLFSGDEFWPESSRVQYGDMPLLRGDMLYKGLQILASASEDEPWAPVILMAGIRVAAVGTNWIDFDYKEARYRIFQEEDGTVVLLDIEKTLALVRDVAESLRRKDIDLNHDGKLTMEDREGGVSRQAIYGAYRIQDLLDPDTLEIYDKRRDGILTRLDIQLFGGWFAALSGVSVWADDLIAGDYDEEGDGLFKESDLSLSKVYFQTATSPSVHEWLTEERFRFIDFNADGRVNSNDLLELERRYGLLIEGQPLLPGVRADEMRVVSAEPNGPIVFEYQAQRWVLYRDDSGTVRLEREIPPAVRAFVDELRALLWHEVEVKPSEVEGQYRIRIFPPDGSVRPLGGVPALIVPGQLHSMSFEVTLRSEWPISIGELPVKVLPKYFEVHYEGIPEVGGALLYWGMLQLAEPGPQGLPNPIAAISLMTKIQISQVDSDGTIHFRYEEENWRIVRDEEGKVRLEKEEEIEEVRKKLLAKVDAEIEAVSEKIDLLTRQIEEAEKRWREEAEKYRTEILDQFVLPLQDLIVELAEISVRDGVSEKTTLEIMGFIDTLNHYLQEELPKEEDTYLEALRWASVIVWEMERRVLNRYRDNLLAYQEKVVAAETLEELEALAGQFPELPPIPMPSLPVLPPDPREPLKTYLEKGKDLLEKAKQEVVPPEVQAYINQLRDQLGKAYLVKVTSSRDKMAPSGYQVLVTVNPAIIRPAMQGLLVSLAFEIHPVGSERVVVDARRLEAVYAGFKRVDSLLLYEGMVLLAEKIDGADPIVLMAKIIVTRGGQNKIYFVHEGKAWIVHRDREGQIRLEPDLKERTVKPTPSEQEELTKLRQVIRFDNLTALFQGTEILSRHFRFTAKWPGNAQLEFVIDPCAESGPQSCMMPAFKATVRITVPSIVPMGSERPAKGLKEIDLRKGVQNVTLYLGDSLRINVPKGPRVGYLNRANEKPRQIIVPRPPIRKTPVITPLPTKSLKPAPVPSKKKKRIVSRKEF